MDLKSVGQILDAHGIKGELKVKLFSQETDWHQDFLKAYIEDQEYIIEHLKPNKTFWILKLKGVVDRNHAETFKGKPLQALSELFTTSEDEEPYLSELLHFSVMLNGQKVGEITSFQETQAHYLLVIKNQNGFFEIPYVDAFIENIDRPRRLIHMCFPEDLLAPEFKI